MLRTRCRPMRTLANGSATSDLEPKARSSAEVRPGSSEPPPVTSSRRTGRVGGLFGVERQRRPHLVDQLVRCSWPRPASSLEVGIVRAHRAACRARPRPRRLPTSLAMRSVVRRPSTLVSVRENSASPPRAATTTTVPAPIDSSDVHSVVLLGAPGRVNAAASAAGMTSTAATLRSASAAPSSAARRHPGALPPAAVAASCSRRLRSVHRPDVEDRLVGRQRHEVVELQPDRRHQLVVRQPRHLDRAHDHSSRRHADPDLLSLEADLRPQSSEAQSTRQPTSATSPSTTAPIGRPTWPMRRICGMVAELHLDRPNSVRAHVQSDYRCGHSRSPRSRAI